jgi:predicted  nucleic acid-binding Zn-ribbon protein
VELTEIASLVGTGFATFAASWATAMRAIKMRAAEPRQVDAIGKKLDELRDVLGDLQKLVVSLEERVKGNERSKENSDRRIERIEERLAKTVTDEEFGAYTNQTTNMLNGLTQQVGRAIGVLDGLRQ